MHTPVHKKQLVVDQYAGIAFDGSKTFKIPVPRKDSKYDWKGSFMCPSTALAKLNLDMDADKRSKEMREELLQAFNNSLRRTDEKPDTKFCITKAPAFNLLRSFGGQMTNDEFEEDIECALQRELYDQVLPSKGDTEEKEVTQKGLWHEESVPSGALPGKYGSGKMTEVPRGLTTIIDYLKRAAMSSGVNEGPFVLYIGQDMFATGDPKAYGKGDQINPVLTAALGGQAFFGDGVVYCKKLPSVIGIKPEPNTVGIAPQPVKRARTKSKAPKEEKKEETEIEPPKAESVNPKVKKRTKSEQMQLVEDLEAFLKKDPDSPKDIVSVPTLQVPEALPSVIVKIPSLTSDKSSKRSSKQKNS